MIGLIIKSDIEPRIEQLCNIVLKGLIADGVFEIIHAGIKDMSQADLSLAKGHAHSYERVDLIALNVNVDPSVVDDVNDFNNENAGKMCIGLHQYFEEIFPKLSLDLLMELSQLRKDFPDPIQSTTVGVYK